jgi:hypothetical protein
VPLTRVAATVGVGGGPELIGFAPPEKTATLNGVVGVPFCQKLAG